MTFLVWAGGASHSYPYYCTTYPEAWVTTYLEPGYFDVDPVLDIIRWGFLPVDWSFSSTGQIRPHPWHRFLWLDHSHPWAKWRTQPFSVTWRLPRQQWTHCELLSFTKCRSLQAISMKLCLRRSVFEGSAVFANSRDERHSACNCSQWAGSLRGGACRGGQPQ